MLEILDVIVLLGLLFGVVGLLGLVVGFVICDIVENYFVSILLSVC